MTGLASFLRRAAAAALGSAGVNSAVGQVAFGPEIPLSNAVVSTLGQGGVTIARAANGVSLAVWSDDRTGDQDVYGSLLDSRGNRLTPLGGFKIAGRPGTHEGDPRIAACGNTFLVVWGDGWNDSNITDVFATRVSTSGAVLDPVPIAISAQPATQHNVRGIASDGIGTFLVPFRTTSATIYGGISTMRVIAATGAPLDPPGGVVLALGDPAQGIKKNPSASYGAGEFLVTWDDQRERCHYPGDAGCIDIYAAFVDPTTGSAIGPPFASSRAFACQEGARNAFDGTNFFVFHNDERATNCMTSDVMGERIALPGTVLDPTDPTGMVGGIAVAADPLGFPGSIQSGSTVWASPCERLVTYVDAGYPSPQTVLRMKRVNEKGKLEFGTTAAAAGITITHGLPSPGVFTRAEIVSLAFGLYEFAYTLNNIPTVRIGRFTSPFLNLIATPQLNFPRGVGIDSQGDIYIADTDNNRIKIVDRNGQLKLSFGGKGYADGQFNSPWGLAVDSARNIYVLDTNNNRVQIFDNTGKFLRKFAALSLAPLGIAVDGSGKIYVADTGGDRVHVFSGTGTPLLHFGKTGTALGAFLAPRAIVVHPNGTIYVADRDNNRIQVFDSHGVYKSVLTGGLNAPRGVALDQAGRLYVADSQNNRVVVFGPSGQIQYAFNGSAPVTGQFGFPDAVALDAAGAIYVSEGFNDRIQVFGCIP